MKKSGKLLAVAVALATLVGASAFADSRRQEETWRGDSSRRYESNRGYRDNERVTVQGQIRHLSRERDGYRVELDRGRYPYWVPSARLGGRDLRVGVSIRLGGVFRGGIVYVDDLGYDDYGYDSRYRDRGYRDDVVHGIVERVNYRRGLLVLRDDHTGRRITVDMYRADLAGLRRGDRVTITGDWMRSGVFEAYRVESHRSRW